MAHKRMMVGLAIDALGSGACFPLIVLYLSLMTGLSITSIGLIMTAGSSAALVIAPLVGTLIDRFGARRVLVAGNLCSATGYFLYLFTRIPAHLVVAVALVATADRLYWAGWPVFVAERVERTDRWYGVVNSIRNVGFGVGGALAAGGLVAAGQQALRAIIVLQSASSLFAAAMFITLIRTNEWHGRADLPDIGGWRVVLRDRPFVFLTACHTAVTYAWQLPSIILPVYLVRVLDLPSWTAPGVFVINIVMVATTQVLIEAGAASVRRTRKIACGCAFFVTSMIIMACCVLPEPPPPLIVPAAGVALFSVGQALVAPSATALVSAMSPRTVRGRYSSFFQLSWTLSAVTAPAMFAPLLQWAPWLMWTTLIALISASAIGFLRTERLVPTHVLLPPQ